MASFKLPLFLLKVVLIAIDLVITLVTFGWIGALKKLLTPKGLRTVPVGNDEAHRVDPRFKNKLVTSTREGVTTLYEMSSDSFRRYASVRFMGTRKFEGWKTPKVKQFSTHVTWKSYAEVGEIAHKFGAALRAIGLVPAPEQATLEKHTTPCSLIIFENTCAEWMMSALGAITQRIIVTTAYATLGFDAVVEAINDGAIAAIVTNKKSVGKLMQHISKMPTLKTIIYTNDLIELTDRTELPCATDGVRILSFDEFVASGDTKAYPPTPPTPDTCAVIMYTSGSTGKPKGVVITHRNVVAFCASGLRALGIEEDGKDSYIAYLPLAHILEFVAEFIMISRGCSICYTDPKSLFRNGSVPLGAMENYSPTLMASVPKILDLLKKQITSQVSKLSPTRQYLVQAAIDARGFALKHGYDTPLFNLLFFNRFKKSVGGRVRLGLSGGGPLNGEVQDFIRTCFGMSIVQGYGLTETCAGCAVQAEDDFRRGIQGVVLGSLEMKLLSTPDVRDRAGQPYLSTDRFDDEGNPVLGRGEICVKGNNVSAGYYLMPEKTKDDFDADGWFHTGDIGQFLPDGCLSVVDRKKNLLKLKGGEYISIEKMEVAYSNADFVDPIAGGICCYGDGDMDRPVALMQLNRAYTLKWAKDRGMIPVDCRDVATIKDSPELYQAIMADLEKEAQKSGLSHLEKLVGVAILTSPWTAENGCLSAANKLQRHTIVQMFDKEFAAVKAKGIFG